MLFNSATFLFVFLPIAAAGFFALGAVAHRLAAAWLAAASVVFYSWWNPAYVPLLLCSIAVNFLAGVSLARSAKHDRPSRKLLLTAAVVFNLALLGYYKYSNFVWLALCDALGARCHALDITLPIGISFFTFTQIAFLVDAYRGEVRQYHFVHYTLFVSYFPHLVAGPILHHREMMPQFSLRSTYRPRWRSFALGVTFLSIGLFKKVGIADHLAPYANEVFATAARGERITLIDGWAGALTYSLQLYFDFSGYSDMAIGISHFFGVRLPVNFDSPYKARNIAEFWRRWHMTLSRFLLAYVYIPLGGNRRGAVRTYVNLLATMVIGGIWHGAGWTFLIWGGLHGVYLVVHRTYLDNAASQWLRMHGRSATVASTLLTFVAVVVGWVFFRADSASAALTILTGMAGGAGLVIPGRAGAGLGPVAEWLVKLGATFGDLPSAASIRHLGTLAALLAAVWLLPNTQQIMARFAPAIPIYRPIIPPRNPAFAWSPSARWLLVTAALGWLGLVGVFSGKESPFLYFNF